MGLSSAALAELSVRRIIARSAGKRIARRKRRGKPIKYPRVQQLAYTKLLLRHVKRIDAAIREKVLPSLPRLLREAKSLRPLRTDAIEDDDEYPDADELLAPIRGELRVLARGVSDHNKSEVNRTIRDQVGIDLIKGESYLQPHLELFVEDNAAMISTLTEEHLAAVRHAIVRGAREGAGVDSIGEEIARRTGISEDRAKFLARDQIASLHGELTQLRQEGLGIEEYEWLTEGDDRVRPDHEDLDGTIQRWDDPPVVNQKTGRVGHPGQDINCRCTARPILDELLGALVGETETEDEYEED